MPGEGGGISPEDAGLTAKDRGEVSEIKITKEAVTNALDSATSILDSIPDTDLTPEQRNHKKAVAEAKAKTLEKGKKTFTNKFEDTDAGLMVSQREGIPVEGLIKLLEEKSKDESLTEEQRDQYWKQARILWKSSKAYHQLPSRMKPSRYVARVRQEAYLISQDERATGDPAKDWELAEKIIRERRELVIPKDESVATGTTVDGSTEAPTEPVLPPSDETVTPATDTLEPTPADTTAATPPGEITREYLTTIANREEEMRKNAQDMAEMQLREEIRRGTLWNPRNWGRKIGLRLSEQYWRQVYIERAMSAMKTNNTAFIEMDLVRNVVTSVNKGIETDRASGQNKLEQIQSGELIAGQQVKEATGELRAALIDQILKPIVDGSITDYGQVQEKLRSFVGNNLSNPDIQALFGKDANQYARVAGYFASDLLEMGQAVKRDLEIHSKTLDQIDHLIKIQLANTSWAAETQANFNWVDKLVRAAEGGRRTDQDYNPTNWDKWRGRLLNPATIGAFASILTFGGLKLTGQTARLAQLLVPGVGLIAGGAIAAARRNYDLKVDMAAHKVDRAYNRQIPSEGAPRREALERYSYDTANTNDLINGSRAENGIGRNRQSLTELLRDPTSNSEAILRRITEIKTRLDFSATEKVDLITFQGREQVEQGRLQLVKSIVEARQALRSAGIETVNIGGEDLDLATAESRLTGEWRATFTQNREQQDNQFRNFRLRNAAGAAGFSMLMGAAGGLVSQEVITVARRVAGDTKVGSTVLENAIAGKWDKLMEGGRAPGFGDDLAKKLFNENGKEQISPGVWLKSEIKLDGTRGWSFVDGSDSTISTSNVRVDSNGHVFVGSKLADVSPVVKNSLTQEGWGLPVETRTSGFGSDYSQILYQKGGQFEIAPGISLKGEINADGTRTFNLVDGSNNVIPSPKIDIDSSGNIKINQGLDKLPANIRAIFEQSGFTTKKVDGLTNPDFNIDKSQDFFKDPLKYGGVLEVNDKVDLAIDPKLDNSDRAVRFLEKGTGTLLERTIEGPPMWITPEGKLIVAGTPDIYPQTVKELVASYENALTTKHNLRNYLSELAKGGVANVPDENIAHGNFIVNTHDLVESNYLNPQGKPYDEWAREAGRIDPVTGQIELGKMSFTFKPENIKINGFLDQDGKFHIPNNFYGNENLTVQQMTRVGMEMKQEGWNVQQVSNGLVVIPPESFEYTPPTITEVAPPPPTYETEFAPPPPGELEQAPMIPLPWAPRHPLENLFKPEPLPPDIYYGPYGQREVPRVRDRKNYTVVDMDVDLEALTAENISQRNDEVSQGFRRIETTPQEALEAFRQDIDQADSVYVVLPYHIGDSISALGYAEAIRKKLDKIGNPASIHFVVPNSMVEILKPLETERLRVVSGQQSEPRIDIATPHAKRNHELKGLETTLSDIKGDPNIKRAIVLDFESLNGGDPTIVRAHGQDKNITVFNRLFQSTFAYGNDSDGKERFQNFASELLGDVDKSEGTNWPVIPLPLNHGELYENIIERSGIDPEQPQISIVLESGSSGRQYSIEQWLQVAQSIQNKYSNLQINFIFNPYKTNNDPTRVDPAMLQQSIARVGLNQAHFVTGNIPELLSFFSEQALVLSNDGGVVHLASCIETGPKVIGLYLPGFANHWRLNGDKTIGIEAPQGLENYGEEWGQTDDEKKWINKIKPDDVSRRAIETLEASGLTAPPSIPVVRNAGASRTRRDRVTSALRTGGEVINNGIGRVRQAPITTPVSSQTPIRAETVNSRSTEQQIPEVSVGEALESLITGAPPLITRQAGRHIPTPQQRAVRVISPTASSPRVAASITTRPPRTAPVPIVGVPPVEVLEATTTPVSEFVSADEMLNDPEGLTGVVNKKLAEATNPTKRLETNPDALVDYLKTLKLPNVQSIDFADARIIDGKLVVKAKLTAKKSLITVHPTLDAVFQTDPTTGELKLLSYDLGNLGPLKGLVEGAVTPYLSNLNSRMIDKVNENIDPNWRMSKLQIVGDRLAFDFERKPSGIERSATREEDTAVIEQAARALADRDGITYDEALERIRQGRF